jgi:hypothetical protein
MAPRLAFAALAIAFGVVGAHHRNKPKSDKVAFRRWPIPGCPQNKPSELTNKSSELRT